MGVELNLQVHLLRMRVTAVGGLIVAVGAAVAAFALRYQGSAVASPLIVTLVAAAASLWIGFSASRDTAGRLEKVRRAFAVHGDEARLLRDHWLVYLVVLTRLEVMVGGGLIVALWGLGPVFGLWLLIPSVMMIALTWPTARKSRLLVGRARTLREETQSSRRRHRPSNRESENLER